MIKTLPVILILALFCVGTMAQNPVTNTQSLKQNLIASGDYFSWSSRNNEISGSPYLTEEFRSGMIHWNRMWYEGIDLRYNIYQSNFEARLENGIIVIDPIKNNMDTLKYNEEVFVKKFLNTDTDLYNKAKPAEYKIQSPVYYVFRGNEQWTVKGSKTLSEIFQINAKVVKSYLKDNKYKLSNEEHLLEAVLYFSSYSDPS
jgi:hypothetical protein